MKIKKREVKTWKNKHLRGSMIIELSLIFPLIMAVVVFLVVLMASEITTSLNVLSFEESITTANLTNGMGWGSGCGMQYSTGILNSYEHTDGMEYICSMAINQKLVPTDDQVYSVTIVDMNSLSATTKMYKRKQIRQLRGS